ncbi:MAG: DUF2378 family protein [Myxococcaceae bacterium]|jgi:uncharacterized protein (TIGR02265 family)|nr:DUF2378 family protein [Myxococcaceae bacterium]
MGEALVFSSTFEALGRALGPRLDAAARQRFKALGVDYDAPQLMPAYPYEQWVKAMDLGSQLLLPGAPADSRHEAMGRQMVDSYGETLVGKAILAAMRIIGPRRMLERMARNLRSANNYTETKLTVTAAGEHHLWCSRVSSERFYRGLLHRSVEVAGGRDVSVQFLAHDAGGATFALRWS